MTSAEELLNDACSDIELTPSYHGKDCLGSGDFPGYDCLCDECDYFLACFPDWKDYI